VAAVDPFELLKVLHSLSAVDESRAVELGLLTRLLGADERSLAEALQSLARLSYVSIEGGRVYLTELGILKISSLFC